MHFDYTLFIPQRAPRILTPENLGQIHFETFYFIITAFLYLIHCAYFLYKTRGCKNQEPLPTKNSTLPQAKPFRPELNERSDIWCHRRRSDGAKRNFNVVSLWLAFATCLFNISVKSCVNLPLLTKRAQKYLHARVNHVGKEKWQRNALNMCEWHKNCFSLCYTPLNPKEESKKTVLTLELVLADSCCKLQIWFFLLLTSSTKYNSK